MKTTILMATLLTSVVMTAAAAQDAGPRQGPDFATLDADGNGSLTIEEMQARGQARFDETDTDGDGAVSLDELTAAEQARATDRAAQMLERLDKNEDGVLQAEELQPRGGDMMQRMFEGMDRDDDGAISEVEFEVAKVLMEERRARRHHGDRDHGRGPGDRAHN